MNRLRHSGASGDNQIVQGYDPFGAARKIYSLKQQSRILLNLKLLLVYFFHYAVPRLTRVGVLVCTPGKHNGRRINLF